MIIWDEYKYGEEVFNKGEIKTKRWQNNELKCLIKYLDFNKIPLKEIRENLIKCCNDDIRYLKDKQIKDIFNKLIQQARREPIVKDKKVVIYKDEVEIIKSLRNRQLEQILFMLLVYRKWVGDGNMEWFAILRSDILKESKLKNVKYDLFQDMLTKLNNTGLITSDVRLVDMKYRRKNRDTKKQMWKINFLQDDGSIAFEIDNYINVVYRYLNYVYGGYFECAKCNGIFEQNKQGSRIYCNSCGKYQPIKTKTITCIDCGKEVIVDGIVKNKKRCDKCQDVFRKNQLNENAKLYYKRKKLS